MVVKLSEQPALCHMSPAANFWTKVQKGAGSLENGIPRTVTCSSRASSGYRNALEEILLF
jgi:hypothetical protein